MTPVVEPKVTSLLILISSSDDEHSNNLARVPLHPVSGAEISHLFCEATKSDMRFRNLKKVTSAIDPLAITTPPISQIPPPTADPIVELVEATVGVSIELVG